MIRTSTLVPAEIRRVEDADIPAVLALCRDALGWPDDPRNELLFRWKHLSNPFGRSAMWVAVSDGRFVGFRAMMRWRFRRPDGTLVTAVRAVDTATHPDYRGRGIFAQLNAQAIGDLRSEKVDFIFNTPNDMSRPGYLKQGWVDAGRVPIVLRSVGLKGLLEMAFARQPGSRWSERYDFGVPGVDLDSWEAGAAWGRHGVTTDLTRAFLNWRFNQGPVGYRCLTHGESGIVVRGRLRGSAKELSISFAWGPERAVQELTNAIARQGDCSYLVAVKGTPGSLGMLPGLNFGPRLTLRQLAAQPPSPSSFAWTLGDIELF